jgi:hypothetical protein
VHGTAQNPLFDTPLLRNIHANRPESLQTKAMQPDTEAKSVKEQPKI